MIYCFLANGFEETEALATVDVLRRAKLEVKLVSIDKEIVTSSRKVSVISDMLIDDICDYSDIDAIILPGGMPGTTNLEACEKLKEIVLYCNDNNKVVSAICAAPMILGHLGLLSGKEATCYPGFEKDLQGAILRTENKAVCDGNIITGKGAGASFEFGFAIVSKLLSQEVADEVRSSMQY